MAYFECVAVQGDEQQVLARQEVRPEHARAQGHDHGAPLTGTVTGTEAGKKAVVRWLP
jgi:hypothetical protein